MRPVTLIRPGSPFSSNAGKVVVCGWWSRWLAWLACSWLGQQRENVIREAHTVMRKGDLSRSIACSIAFIGSLSQLVLGCKRTADPAPAQAGYPTPPAATAQQAPGYGDGTTPQPTPVMATAPAHATATLSQPSPMALPCQADGQCLTHHCNIAAGKCAWPCQTDDDCMPGNRCIAPTCLPKLQ
jgi:hypothetical protein